MNDDVLTGAGEIAAHIRRSQKSTYHLLEQGKLPAFKLGGQWCSRRSTLDRHFSEQERANCSPIVAASMPAFKAKAAQS